MSKELRTNGTRGGSDVDRVYIGQEKGCRISFRVQCLSKKKKSEFILSEHVRRKRVLGEKNYVVEDQATLVGKRELVQLHWFKSGISGREKNGRSRL